MTANIVETAKDPVLPKDEEEWEICDVERQVVTGLFEVAKVCDAQPGLDLLVFASHEGCVLYLTENGSSLELKSGTVRKPSIWCIDCL